MSEVLCFSKYEIISSSFLYVTFHRERLTFLLLQNLTSSYTMYLDLIILLEIKIEKLWA